MYLLTFLIYTIIAIAANVGMNRFMYAMIQEGNLFGEWQLVLDKFYSSESATVQLIGKLLGNCEMCFYHLWSIIGFGFYAIIGNHLNTWAVHSWYNILWYLMYVPCVWVISLSLNKSNHGV